MSDLPCLNEQRRAEWLAIFLLGGTLSQGIVLTIPRFWEEDATFSLAEECRDFEEEQYVFAEIVVSDWVLSPPHNTV